MEHALADAVVKSAKIAEQRDLFLAVLGELRDSVVILDPNGNEVFRNPPAERYREARHADRGEPPVVTVAPLGSQGSKELLGFLLNPSIDTSTGAT